MVVEVKIDYDECTSCKKCVEACTFGVLEWLDDMPIVVNPSSCALCLECENLGPKHIKGYGKFLKKMAW